MVELDLSKGDPDAADKIQSEGQAARASRSKSRTTTSKRKSPAASDAADKDIRSRLVAAFSDLADQAAAHEDEELADVLTRRKEAMSNGLVSLTRNLTILRSPLLFFLIVLEPVLAFWELGGLAARRYVARSQRIKEERRMQAGVTGVTGNQAEESEYAG